VVINFDKFNPKVGTPNGIPLLGEMMVSRWAFEAYMVTQYKDNPLEKVFYSIDQKKYLADYKRNYYIPQLESKLSYVISHREGWNNSSEANKVKSMLDLLRNELTFEAKSVGKKMENKIPEFNGLAVGKFDSAVYFKTLETFATLRKFYNLRSQNALVEQQKLVDYLTDGEEKKVAYEELKKKYQNNEVKTMVENTRASKRVVEWDGELVQKIYPIFFNEHRPNHFLDFRDNFYIPAKYFAGQKFDTLYFNLSIIWLITIFLYVALYYELLKKAVHGFTMRRKYGGKRLKE
jgi:hypothetical protein